MTAIDDAVRELARARRQHGTLASAHEGIAVIEEEFIELRNEVFWGPTRPHSILGSGQTARVALMRAEAVQLAAMALRFIEEVCDGAQPGGTP